MGYIGVCIGLASTGCSVQDRIVSTDQKNIKAEEKIEANVEKYVLEVECENVLFPINENLFGLFFEDINKAGDGGLNPELVENRSFEQVRDGVEDIFTWKIVSQDETSTYCLVNDQPLNTYNPNYLRLTMDEKVVLKNIGHNGIPVQEDEVYKFSIWIKNNDYKGKLRVYVENVQGNKSSGEVLIDINEAPSGEWAKYTAELVGEEKSVGNLVVEFEGKGIVETDFISLMPTRTWRGEDEKKWPYGGLRFDLVEALNDLSPGFIRFPGGCVAEGEGLDNLYCWKDTIGPLEERKEQKNTWGYWQSYGLGYHEYFQLCEDLGAQPIPVVHAGITCQIRRPGEYYTPGSEAFEESIQDALDLIEYANGDTSTYWGKKREENGHAEPFGLKYLAVGNENWGKQYFENFSYFKERIEKMYPEIILITSSGPWASGSEYDMAWKEVNKKYTDTVVDEHFYMTPEWFLGNTDRYDYYDREGGKVFVGEYAAHNGRVNNQVPASGNTLYSALAEAAFMTGLERNGDIVELASYAPLFAKQGDTQWFYDMIWFDHYNRVLTPNYYVQKLFSQNTGDLLIASQLSHEKNTKEETGGGILLGGWSSAVAFDWVQVVSNKDGSILFEDDFEDGEIDPLWTVKNGNWIEENGVLKQTSISDGEKAIYIENVNWQDYTVKVQVKKTSGKEGFLIGVGVKGPDDFIWYNAGGWGNTKDAVERSIGGVKGTIGFVEEGSFLPVKTNATYKVEMEYSNNLLKIVREDKVIQETALKDRQQDVYTSVTEESGTGEIIIKVVNVQDKEVELLLEMEDRDLGEEQIITTLFSENPQAVNSFKNPEMVKPIKETIRLEEGKEIMISPYSVNVIRLKTQ